MTDDLDDYAEANDPYGPSGSGGEHPAFGVRYFDIFGSVDWSPIANAGAATLGGRGLPLS